MNKNTYKLKFDRQQGMLVAVSEITTANGKGVGQGTISSPIKPSVGAYFILKQIVAILLTAALPLTAHAQIISDANQVGSKPIVSVAGNGVPIVNIVAPNSNGVSLNQFNQYNIDSNGAILNNSGGMSNTQLAGYIPANPMLGNASANTIINQVTGPSGSNINGYQEIAGHKANLVIANPNGISVNGGGFINTGKVTLTTGTPQLTNGALTGVNVTTGNIAINGDGLNASNLDKLTLITRAAQLNAQIWADKTDLILGANQVTLDEQGNTGNISSQTGQGTAPTFALDVAQMGGMYANQMRIIGTEAGLGVNNGGKLIAETPLTLDVNGNLSNAGQINGGNDSSIKATSVDNSGDITTVNNLQLTSTGQVTNSGSITAGSVQLDATGLANSGSITQTGAQKLDITANTLSNTGRIGIADQPTNPEEPAPTTSSNTSAPSTSTASNVEGATPTTSVATDPVVLKDGYINITGDASNSGVIDAGAAININSQTLANSGKVQTAGALNINSTAINNQSGTLKSQISTVITSNTLDNSNAGLIQAPNLTITANTINNSNSGSTGGLIGENTLTLNADGQINNSAGYIAGGQLTLNTPKLINTKGTIVTSSDLTLDNATLDNQQGTIGAKNLTLNNQTLNNQGGTFNATETLTASAQTINNQGGALTAGQKVTVNAGNLNNQDGGLIQAQHINLKADNLDNRNSGNTGGIIGTADLTIDATQIDNSTGYIAGQTTTISSKTLNNTSGTIAGGASLNLASSQLTNQQGLISAQGSASINSATIDNQQGTLTANNLNIQSTTLNNQGGTAIASKALSLKTSTLNNQDGGLVQGTTATINTDTVINTNSGDTGGIIGTEQLNLNATQSINNSTGYIAGGQTTISTATLTNAEGSILANSLNTNSTDIDNSAGSITAYTTNTITANTFNNQGGLVQAGTTATLNIANIDNRNTKQDLSSAAATNNPLGIQANTLNISGNSIDNSNGQIIAGTITSTGQTLNNQSGQVIADNASITTSEQLDNSNGQLIADNTLALDTPNLLNTGGKVHSNDTLNLAIHGNYTSAGQITSANHLNLAVDNDFAHSNTANLNAAGKLAISAANITNQTDASLNAGHTALTASGTITNHGTIDGGLVELRANTIDNNSKIYGGTTDGSGGIVIGADTINNNPNAVIASRGNIAIGTRILNNEKGALIQSLGDFAIGGTLNTDYSISGQAEQVNNKSATIEVGKDVTQWDVARTLNQNTEFSTTQGAPVTSDASYYIVDGQQVDGGNIVLGGYYAHGYTHGAPIGFINDDLYNAGVGILGAHMQINTGDVPVTSWLSSTAVGSKMGFVIINSDGSFFNPNLVSKDNLQILEINKLIKDNRCGLVGHAGVTGEQMRGCTLSVEVEGFESTQYLKASEKTTAIEDAFGWKYYTATDGSINVLNEVGYKTVPIDFEHVTLAYYPKRTYTANYRYELASSSSSVNYGSDVTTKEYNESFTYNKDDIIWSRFGVSAPLTNLTVALEPAPIPPQTSWGSVINCASSTALVCVKYNEKLLSYENNLAVYTEWVDQNRGKYIELNRKILAFNADVSRRMVYSFNAFTGTATSNAPIVASSAPAKIIVGGNMTLDSGTITNDKSQIVVGGVLHGNPDNIVNDNTGATAQVVTTYSGTMNQVSNGRITGTVAANPAPSIQTVNLSVAEFRTNAGAQALNGQAGTQGGTAASETAGHAAAVNGVVHNQDNTVYSPITSIPTGSNTEVRTVAFNGILPSNVLFTQHGDPAASYLIETDPAFTNKQAFLSSDYMLGQLAADPNNVWKRLGDGFYEQRLINEQIITATGKRFTGDYSSNEAQYKALMTNGVAYGKQYGLSIGTALTPEQMKSLTTDMVWMVKETVTLKDGTQQTVLVPKVYLATKVTDIKGDGTIIAAKHNWLDVKGDVTNNGGTFAGTSSMDVSAHNIDNRGGLIGGNAGGIVNLRVSDRIDNIGGTIRGGQLALNAKTINVETTTQTTHSGNMAANTTKGYASTRSAIDQIGQVQALDADRDGQPALTMVATDSITLKAADLQSAGSAVLVAKDINSTTVDTGFAEQTVWSWSKKNKSRNSRSDTAEVGSTLQSAGDLTMVADNGINLRQTTAVSDGELALIGKTITVEEGRATHDSESYSYTKKKGFLSSKSSTSSSTNHADTSVGSTLIGQHVTILAEGDTTVKGSTVFGTHGVDIASEKGNINLISSQDQFNDTQFNQTKKSGFGALGGFSIGKMSSEQGQQGTQIGHTGSTIASLDGNINLQAKQGTLNVEGSVVDSANGKVNGIAQNIRITDVTNTATSDSYTKTKSTGLSVSISSPLMSAANSASTIAEQAGNASGGTQVGAVAVSGALAGYNAYRGVKGVVDSLATATSAGDVLGALGSLNISLGTQKSSSKTHEESATSQGSSVTGQSVNLLATGQGKADDSTANGNAGNQDSDIYVQGSTVAGTRSTTLKADDDIIGQAGINTSNLTSSNKSSGGSIGVSISATGISANASVNMSKGNAKGNSLEHTETIIGSTTGQTTFESGDDTALNGAAIIGKKVTGQVGGDLTIATLQDTSDYTSRQTSAGFGVSVPITGVGAWSVSANASKQNTNANHQTAVEQSGIYAGTDGLDVTVNGHTDLTGAVISSTATPDKVNFATGTLTTRDLQNSSTYNASSMGISGSYSGTQTTDRIVTTTNGTTTTTQLPNRVPAAQNGNPTTGGAAGYQAGINGFSPNAPSFMNAQGDETSTTQSSISNGTLTITDAAGQQSRTGQTGEQTIANLNRDINADAPIGQGLTNLYEQDKDKITTGFAIAETLSKNTSEFLGLMAKDMDKVASATAVDKDGKVIYADIKDADGNTIGKSNVPLTNAQAHQQGYALGDTSIDGQTINYGTRQELWGSTGYGSVLLAGISGAVSGNVTGSGAALAQNTAINVIRSYSATVIKGIADEFMIDGQTSTQSELIRGALHAIAGCAGAAATGGDCGSAAAGSAGAVALNAILSQNTETMTETQKQAYSNLIQTIVGGTTAALGGDAGAAALASKIEVENNLLSERNINKALNAAAAGDRATVIAMAKRAGANDRELKRIYEKRKNGEPLTGTEVAFIKTLHTNTAGAAVYDRAGVDRIMAQHPEWGDDVRAALETMTAVMNNPEYIRQLNEITSDFSVNYKPLIVKTASTQPPVLFSVAGINVIDNKVIPDVGYLTAEEFAARAASNGLNTAAEIDAWFKTLPTQADVCSGLVVGDGCAAAYTKNMTMLVNAYPGVPVSQLSNQIQTVAALSRIGDDSFGKLAWDAAGKTVDLAAVAGYKPAGVLASGKTVADIAYQIYDENPKGATYDAGVWLTTEAIGQVIKKKVPDFESWPEKQQDFYIESIKNAVGVIADQNKPNFKE